MVKTLLGVSVSLLAEVIPFVNLYEFSDCYSIDNAMEKEERELGCLDVKLMADFPPDASHKSELLDLKHISTSIFSIPGFLVGFGAKGASESDAGKSPTSPLDFGVFTSFGGLFSPRSPACCSSPRKSQPNKWVHEKVGLSLLNSLANDTGPGKGDCDDSLKRENVLLAPHIKINNPKTAKLSSGPPLKSNSLPKKYAAVSVCDSVNLCPQQDDSHMRTLEEPNSPMKSSSSPMNIVSSRVYSRSVSARVMSLSEDYTCIISHGPNPKTTHIFGDCILDCDPKELADFDTKEEVGNPEDDSPSKPPEDFSSCFCWASHTREILAEEEMENCGEVFTWIKLP